MKRVGLLCLFCVQIVIAFVDKPREDFVIAAEPSPRLQLLREQADGHDGVPVNRIQAAFDLAKIYLIGSEGAASPRLAQHYFKIVEQSPFASEQQKVQSSYYLGLLASGRHGLEADDAAARSYFEYVVSKRGRFLQPRLYALVCNNLGELYFYGKGGDKNRVGAEKLFKEVVASDNISQIEKLRAQFYLGRVYFAGGKLDEAEEWFKKVMDSARKDSSNYAYAQLYLAYSYVVKIRKNQDYNNWQLTAKAKEFFKTVADGNIAGASVDARYALGELYYWSNECDKAKECFEILCQSEGAQPFKNRSKAYLALLTLKDAKNIDDNFFVKADREFKDVLNNDLKKESYQVFLLGCYKFGRFYFEKKYWENAFFSFAPIINVDDKRYVFLLTGGQLAVLTDNVIQIHKKLGRPIPLTTLEKIKTLIDCYLRYRNCSLLTLKSREINKQIERIKKNLR